MALGAEGLCPCGKDIESESPDGAIGGHWQDYDGRRRAMSAGRPTQFVTSNCFNREATRIATGYRVNCGRR